MKIAFLLTQSLDSPSGLGRYAPLARSLVHLGHKVEILALHPDFRHLTQREVDWQGVCVRYVAPMHVSKQGNLKSYYPPRQLAQIAAQATYQLLQASLTSQADLFHVGKPHPMNSLAGWMAARLKGRPLFLDCDDYESGSGHFSGRWQQRGVALFERLMPTLTRGVTTNTRFMQANLLRWGVLSNHIFYLPNGVDRARFGQPDSERIVELRRELDLQNRPVVLYLGSLSLASHAVDLLLDSFPGVLQAYPEAVLMVVGGGEDFDRLQAQAVELGISRSVRFLGRVDPAQAALYYRLAAVSVDPVRDDSAAWGRSPLKLFESWACGVPFVSADVGDRRSLIGVPPAGLLARPGDPSALAQAITSILSSPTLAHELRQRGTQRLNLYDWDVLAAGLDSFYHRILQQ